MFHYEYFIFSSNNSQEAMLRQQYVQAMMQGQGQPPLVPVPVPPAPSKPPPPIPSSTSPSGQKKNLQNTKLTSKVPVRD